MNGWFWLTFFAFSAGHVFSMPHDNVKACEDVFGKLKDNHMMSPTLIQIDHISPWSVCSAAIITDFLDSGHGQFSCSVEINSVIPYYVYLIRDKMPAIIICFLALLFDVKWNSTTGQTVLTQSTKLIKQNKYTMKKTNTISKTYAMINKSKDNLQ